MCVRPTQRVVVRPAERAVVPHQIVGMSARIGVWNPFPKPERELVFAVTQMPNMSAFLFDYELIDPQYHSLIVTWSRDMDQDKIQNVVRDLKPCCQFESCDKIGFHPGPCWKYHLYDFASFLGE